MTGAGNGLATGLLERLERHYIRPDRGGGIFVHEVGTNDGGATGRRCDAVFVGFTSSSGRLMIGHEVKVNRSDWLKELDQPGKADFWHDNCHAWYVVAPSEAVVKREELPHGWGLLLPNARSTVRMDTAVRAAIRDTDPGWLAVRSVMARYDTLRAAAVRNAAAAEVAKLREEYDRQLAALREGRPPDEPLDPTVRIAQQLVKAAQAATAEAGLWGRLDQATVVAAILDQERARHRAQELEAEIRRRVNELQRVCGPLRGSLAQLEKLSGQVAQDAAAMTAPAQPF